MKTVILAVTADSLWEKGAVSRSAKHKLTAALAQLQACLLCRAWMLMLLAQVQRTHSGGAAEDQSGHRGKPSLPFDIICGGKKVPQNFKSI